MPVFWKGEVGYAMSFNSSFGLIITRLPSGSNSRPLISINSFVCFNISALVGFLPLISCKCFLAIFQTLSPFTTVCTVGTSGVSSSVLVLALSALSVLSVLSESCAEPVVAAAAEPVVLPAFLPEEGLSVGLLSVLVGSSSFAGSSFGGYSVGFA